MEKEREREGGRTRDIGEKSKILKLVTTGFSHLPSFN
jgi:hypothetical protein